jgi:hypothetical protein
VDPEVYINKFVHEEDLAPVVLKYSVKNPDVDVITDTIVQMKIVSEPFCELHVFRNQCFHCFSVQQKAMLRLGDLLHLYVAAYQNPAIWKTVWKLVFPVLSIQIIKDVETFVSENKFNDEAVMNILFENIRDI